MSKKAYSIIVIFILFYIGILVWAFTYKHHQDQKHKSNCTAAGRELDISAEYKNDSCYFIKNNKIIEVNN